MHFSPKELMYSPTFHRTTDGFLVGNLFCVSVMGTDAAEKTLKDDDAVHLTVSKRGEKQKRVPYGGGGDVGLLRQHFVP